MDAMKWCQLLAVVLCAAAITSGQKTNSEFNIVHIIIIITANAVYYMSV